MLVRAHRQGSSGSQTAQRRSAIIDTLIQQLFAFTQRAFSKKQLLRQSVSIIALGGYGREELCPMSDIDILFLCKEGVNKDDFQHLHEALSSELLYPLWDLKLKVGHGSRTISECIQLARKDIKTRNALLEARYLAGNKTLFKNFERSFKAYTKEHVKGFIKDRLTVQANRHKRYDDTIFLQEPDIKNGVGGLRDYQNMLWLAQMRLGTADLKALHKKQLLRKEELKALQQAYDALIRIRCELHLQSTRPNDILTLDKQPQIALKLGYQNSRVFKRVEAFMKDYYHHASTIFDLAHLLEHRLDHYGNKRSKTNKRRKEVDGFWVSKDNLSYTHANIFTENPVRLIRCFRYCQQYSVTPDFELAQRIRESLPLISQYLLKNKDAATSFKAILQDMGRVYPILRMMHELGVLGKYIPEFGKLTCLVQHEYYHRYTADIHTLNTIKVLDSIVAEKEATHYHKALYKTDNPHLLYLTLLLHDIGKAQGIKNHAEVGAKLSDAILERLHIEKTPKGHIRFVIEQHLAMTRFWQQHDLDNPESACHFAKIVGTTEQLHHLYIHTFCDAKGTTPDLWNSHKEALHRRLYETTLEALVHGPEGTGRQVKDQKAIFYEAFQKQKGLTEAPKEEIEAHFNTLPASYFANKRLEGIALHIDMVHAFFKQMLEETETHPLKPIIHWEDDLNQNLTLVNVVTWDRAGLFYKLAGAFTVAGLTILGTKTATREDDIALDTFIVAKPGGGAAKDPQVQSVFEKALVEALLEGKELLPTIKAKAHKSKSLLSKREKRLDTHLEPQVEVSLSQDLHCIIAHIETNDHLGLLYELGKIFFDHKLNIVFGRILTERYTAIDSFHLESADTQLPLENHDLEQLEKALLDTCTQGRH